MNVLFRFLKPYWGRCALVLLTVVFDVAGALLIPTITAGMINLAVSGGALTEIAEQGLIMLLVSLISGAGPLVGSWVCAGLSADLGRDMREAVYDKSLAFSAADFERFGTASMITRTLNDINVIQQSFVMTVQMIVPVPIMCVMGIWFSFRINPSMGLLILGFTVVLLIAATMIVRRAEAIFAKLQRFLDRMNVVLRENITGVRVIRAFNKEGNETKRMGKTFEDYAQASIRANRLFAGMDSLATVLINFCVVAILYVGANQVGLGGMNIGDITAVTEYAIWILFYIMMAQMVIMMLPRAKVCLSRIGEILDLKPEITDGAKTLPLLPQTMGDEVIRLDDVSFRFADADEDALSHISFACRRGQTTAIIGGTGSGKSTIAQLILRSHDVTGGKVLLEGTDVRDIAQNTLRARVSYVPQRAWLFSGNVAENLRYGAPDASEEELTHALHVAQSDFVLGLPDGLNSHVAQGGTNFSGGQRQRLSIARALAKKADLYVFDDSFSALDFKTDAALRHALKEEVKDSAVLIIAQRVSTILHADQILVLDDGRVAGLGRHEELMKSCEVYQEIVRSQLKGGEASGR